MSNLKPGQRVWSQDLPPGSEPTGTMQGTVIGPSADFGGMVRVEWDDGLVSDEVPGDVTPEVEAE